ncbi:Caspase-2 [Mizuhopecten yessoensis]|uniref:Caspase-2 n=1 Tax=Mizuhopecten yessoensis TaxID=6573 RepID=A0A210Q4B4_MIZYE|nr:Caspase-2 [Mizuhopecten yessoensis]
MMEKNHKEAIRKNYTFIIENLTPESVVDSLHQEEILTMYMKEDVEVCKTRRDKVVKLLDILVRRGPRAFDSFITALHDTEQKFVAEKLLETVQIGQNKQLLNGMEI